MKNSNFFGMTVPATERNKRVSMRNRYGRVILCIMTVFCAAAFLGCGTKTVKDNEVVLEVAGQPVVKAEYQMILNSYAAQVKGQYTTDQANQEDFWTRGQDQTPLEQIMELAEQDILHKKVVAQLVEEAEIAKETDYLSVMEQMETENQKRQEKEASGEIVYGLTSFTAGDYYTYVCTEWEAQLLENLKSKFDVADQELEEIYQKNIQEYTSQIRVEMLVAELRAEKGVDQITQAAKDMKEETDLEVLKEDYPDINFYNIEMSSLNTQEGKSGGYTQRWLAASAMQPGEVCEPFSIGSNYMAMRCLKREEQAPEPFEDIKGILKSNIQTQKAQQEIEEKVQKEEIALKVTQKQLESIALEVLNP